MKRYDKLKLFLSGFVSFHSILFIKHTGMSCFRLNSFN